LYDLTLCPGTGCPLRDDCLRFRAKPLARFDAFTHAPYDPHAGTCPQLRSIEALRPTHADIARRAYDRWLAEGQPTGRADDHWRAAEAELDARFRDGFA
jgi:hypothetical protein